jgi:2-polyprenyl-3-methyl-5-hydroxy-6-metoxy-1,4-benzoquinol methylase
MTNKGAESSKAFWNRITAKRTDSDDPSMFGTVTEDRDVVRLRDELERRHVLRHAPLSPSTRVLDVGGGAGRFAIPLAREVAHVTLVDISEALLAVAERRAREEGLANLSFVCIDAQSFVPEGEFDLVLVMDLCTYLTDEELGIFAERMAGAVRPGGTLILKEPVSTDGTLHLDHGRDPGDGYLARFRPREAYAAVFGAHLKRRYQSATLSHPIPWFLKGTSGAVAATRSPLASAALRTLTPAFVRADPWLLKAETFLRRRPALAPLLAPVLVLHDLYVFEKMPRA